MRLIDCDHCHRQFGHGTVSLDLPDLVMLYGTLSGARARQVQLCEPCALKLSDQARAFAPERAARSFGDGSLPAP